MDAKTTSIVAYLTLVGFLVALLAGDKDNALAKNHLNNALVLLIFGLASVVPILGQLWAIFILVNAIMGIVHAAKEEEFELILLGKIKILK